MFWAIGITKLKELFATTNHQKNATKNGIYVVEPANVLLLMITVKRCISRIMVHPNSTERKSLLEVERKQNQYGTIIGGINFLIGK